MAKGHPGDKGEIENYRPAIRLLPKCEEMVITPRTHAQGGVKQLVVSVC